mgnify:CR=1 FL=1
MTLHNPDDHHTPAPVPDWDGVERRLHHAHDRRAADPISGDSRSIQVLAGLLHNLDFHLRELRQSHDANVLLLHEHMADEAAMVNRLLKAFPGDDPVRHRLQHDAELSFFERKKRVQDAIIEKSLAGLAWMALVGIGTAVWFYIKSLLHLT